MKTADLTELAVRNLRESLLRNSLTTLGIAVGVASLVAMLSLGVGLQQLVTQRLERSGLFDSVLVRQATAQQARQGPGQDARDRFLGRGGAPQAAPRPLDESARQQLAQIPHVVEVYPELRFTADLRFGAGGRVTQVASLPPSAGSSDALDGMTGRFFSAPDAHETILQMEVARMLADNQHLQPADLVGKDIVFRYAGREPLTLASADAKSGASSPPTAAANDVSPSPEDAALGFSIISSEISLRVVGIVDAEAVTAGPSAFVRAGAYVPLSVAQGLSVVQGGDVGEVIGSSAGAGGNHYANLTVRVDRPSEIPAVEDAVKDLGYSAFSLLDVSQNLRRVFAILDLLLGVFGSLALAVASLGIVNTLVMSILERRREIGVFKALGASDLDIRQIFFAEAGGMGLVGGAAGVTLGWAIGRIIQFVTTIYLRRQSIPAENIWSVPWWLVVGAMAFSVLVSLAAGMYPASRAARLDPIEALRYE